jgi:DNA-directed RNA polymerase subunit F
MIKSMNSISMAEALEYLKDAEGKESDVKGFIKKFTKLSPEKAKQIREKIESLDLMKVREEHISEIINLLPENSDELNKIFKESNLDEDESKKILDILKENK